MMWKDMTVCYEFRCGKVAMKWKCDMENMFSVVQLRKCVVTLPVLGRNAMAGGHFVTIGAQRGATRHQPCRRHSTNG